MNYLFGIILTVMGTSPSLIPVEESATAKFTYTSENCSYDVYWTQAGGHIGCNDWDYKGRVSPGRNVTVTLHPGDNIAVRIVHKGAEVCDGSRQKMSDNLSFRSDATRSSTHSRELHDWECP